MRWSVMVLVFMVAALVAANGLLWRLQVAPPVETGAVMSASAMRTAHAGSITIYKTTPDTAMLRPVLQAPDVHAGGDCPVGRCQDV